MNQPTLKNLVRLSVARVWFTFSAIEVVAFICASIVYLDHPLRSDDSYVAGTALGFLAACFAVLCVVLEQIARRFVWRSQVSPIVYASVVGLWCLYLLALGLIGTEGEGAGLSRLLSIVSVVVGGVTYALCRVKLPRIVVRVVSWCGGIVLVMHVGVTVHLFGIKALL